MKTIIAATDFSDIACNAVYYAAHLSASVGAKLILYHAVETNAIVVESTMMNLGEYYADDALVKLEQLKTELIAFTDNSIPIEVKLRWGKADAEMAQLCYEEKPFVLVMAATKKHFLDTFLTGSRTINISRQCEAPLLLVPENVCFKNINTIAIAADFKVVAGSMPLRELTHWIKNFTAGVEIVNIAPDHGLSGENVAEAIATETHLDEFHPQFRYITSNNPLLGLHEYEKKYQPDLLIVIPKTRSLFHKSLCKQLILHPSMPLLIMRKHLQDCNCE